MAKHLRIEALESRLPGLHCGSCGAPTAMPLRRMWCWGGPLWTTAFSGYGSVCGMWPDPGGTRCLSPSPLPAEKGGNRIKAKKALTQLGKAPFLLTDTAHGNTADHNYGGNQDVE